MWQPVTDHELAWEYLQAGLLWYGTPADPEDGGMTLYPSDYHEALSKEMFIHKSRGIGDYDATDCFLKPHYICIEE